MSVTSQGPGGSVRGRESDVNHRNDIYVIQQPDFWQPLCAKNGKHHYTFYGHLNQSQHTVLVNSDEKAGSELDAPGACDQPDIGSCHHVEPLHHLRQHNQALLREAQGCQP